MTRNKTSFEQGNQAATVHGARSRIAVENRAADVRAELTSLLQQHLPHVTPADQPLVDVAVDITTKLRLMAEFFDTQSGGSLIDTRGKPRPAAELYLRTVRTALDIYQRLGIGPGARALLLGSLGMPSPRVVQAQEAHKRLRATVAGDQSEEAS